MISITKFGICSDIKTYASVATTEKAIENIEKYVPEGTRINFLVVKLEEHNCENPKYFGRFIPVAIGIEAANLGLFNLCHVIG